MIWPPLHDYSDRDGGELGDRVAVGDCGVEEHRLCVGGEELHALIRQSRTESFPGA